MMTGPPAPRDELDVPLVWDRTPSGPQVTQTTERSRRPANTPHRWGRARLWVATLADLGEVLLSLAAAWGVAAACGAALTPAQLAASGLAGLLVAAVLGVGALWGWRASPGMALLHMRFAAPLGLGRAVWVWLGWVISLVAVGLPLQLGGRGRTLAERLAGSEITVYPFPGGV
jgi:hypothetical protein